MALIDTAVGILIGALVTTVLEHIRARRERSRSGRDAALVLAMQLSEAVAAIDFHIQLVHPIEAQLAPSVRATWAETRQALVGLVSDPDFLRLTLAISTVEELSRISSSEALAPDTEWMDHRREHVRQAAEVAWIAARPKYGWLPAPVADTWGGSTGLGRPSAPV